MKWPVKDTPIWGTHRNVWKFAWFPKKMKMWPSDVQRHTDVYQEYWVWLEKYHVVQSYNSYDCWADMDEWIYKNLDSRYAITPALSVDTNNHLVTAYKIGVEDAKELTMLSLSCPHLDKK